MLSNKLLYFWDFTRNLLVSRNVLYNIYTCFFFFWLCHAQHAGSKFPDQGSNLCPPWWKRGTLITGLPGNFLQICYKELFSTEIFRWAEYTIYNSVHHWEVYLAESEVLGSSYFSKEEKKKKKKTIRASLQPNCQRCSWKLFDNYGLSTTESEVLNSVSTNYFTWHLRI